MTITEKTNRVKGEKVLTFLQSKDSVRKNIVSTTKGVAVGTLTFPNKKEDWNIVEIPYTYKTENRSFPAVVCKDITGTEHAIALSAFREKQPIVEPNGNILNTDNLTDVDASYVEIWECLQKLVFDEKKQIKIGRVKGKRSNFYGNYEYFTAE